MVRYLYNEGSFSHYQRLYYLYDTLGSVAQVTAENGLALQYKSNEDESQIPLTADFGAKGPPISVQKDQ